MLLSVALLGFPTVFIINKLTAAEDKKAAGEKFVPLGLTRITQKFYFWLHM